MVSHILNNKAFSLIELSIVMGVIALLTTAVFPVAIRSFEIKAAEKTIAEVGIIQDAVKEFRREQKVWPSSLLQMKDLGYISPLWALLNPWNNPYEISSKDNTFSVSTSVPDNLVNMLASRLPQTSINGRIVTSVIGAGGVDVIPIGVITAWSGTIASIPIGWVLCDGANGTPDLRDKFIVGANKDDGNDAKSMISGTLTKSGGTISHMHGGSTEGHQLTIAEMPRHHHGYMATPWTGSRYDGSSSPLMTQQVQGNTDDTGGDQPHVHGIGPDFHLPPYYALAFIMKIS